MDFQEKQSRTLFFMAKNLGEAECFEDMVDAMKNLAELNVDLTEDERNLLDVGYKNVIKKRWKSWKILSLLERQGEENGNELHVMRIMKYKHKVVTLELDRICNEVLAVIYEHLIPSATSRESLVSYCTIIGNIFRGLTHTELQADMNVAAIQILRAYQDQNGISTAKNVMDKISSTQTKSSVTKRKVQADQETSSLFNILRQSSIKFESKDYDGPHVITESQAAHKFSAFKLRRISKLE